jgi:hypothetical protein
MARDVGTPSIKVELIKQSQHYAGPNTEIDFSISDFYNDYGEFNIKSDNVYVIKELGVAMVQPLIVNRSNYLENSLKPRKTPYQTEHPAGPDYSETDEEINRRVFIPQKTLHQFMQSRSGLNLKADYMLVGENWEYEWPYSGPVYFDALQPPPKGAKREVSWIYQDSAADNVEWLLVQKQPNFTNQSFWVEVSKAENVAMNADESDGTTSENEDGTIINDHSRYYRYGGKNIRAYFAITIGWVGSDFSSESSYPVITNANNSYIYDAETNEGYGPYDIVFPVDGYPFIWDFGSFEEIDLDGSGLSDQVGGNDGSWRYPGYCASEMAQEEWKLKENIDNFKIFVFNINGRMVIKTSFSGDSAWIFPNNVESKVSEKTKEKYQNFFIPPGKVCIHGRGFSFRMSYNPMEFNIYSANGERKSPCAKLISRPIQERTTFPVYDDSGNISGTKKGGFIDYYNYSHGNYVFNNRQNFLCIPRANDTNHIYGFPEGFGYGLDIMMNPLPNLSGNASFGYTSMMIGVDGADPHSMIGPEKLIYTYTRPPKASEAYALTQPISTMGMSVSREDQQFETKLLEIWMNCMPPTMCATISNTSERFASPIVWRIKMKHYIPKTSPVGPPLDISKLVKSISYDSQVTDYDEVRMNYKIEVYVPKKYQFGDGAGQYYLDDRINTREKLIDWLNIGVKDVIISLGWKNGDVDAIDPALNNPPYPFVKDGDRVRVFRGMIVASPMKESYAEDIITLDCKDKMQILDDQKILNSPYYDGMALPDAFKHICTLGGLPKEICAVESLTAHNEVLGVGYNWTQPAERFETNTSILEAIRKVSRKFWHVLRSNPQGQIVLTDLNFSSTTSAGSADRQVTLEELNLTHPSYVFYVDPSKKYVNPFQIALNSVSINKDFMVRYTNIELMYVDKGLPGPDGEYSTQIDNRSFDLESIENPSYPDFVGYKKPQRLIEPAFGSKAKARHAIEMLESHAYETPLVVTLNVYGRPTLRVFDIIQLVLPDTTDNASNHVYIKNKLERIIKLRVVSLSGKISLDDPLKHSMTITAEHK